MSYKVVNGVVTPAESNEIYNSSIKLLGLNSTKDFKNLFDKKLGEKNSFIISGHAAQRLESRNISLNQEDMKIINEGINKAEEKGCRNSVILYKNNALVTSITNRTVITIMDKNSSKDNIFTNVDSVVLL